MKDISIVGPGEYDDVVAEIDFSPAFVAVLRNEQGNYYLEIFNTSVSQIDEFAMGQKRSHNSVKLDDFLEKIRFAQKELEYQSKSPSS